MSGRGFFGVEEPSLRLSCPVALNLLQSKSMEHRARVRAAVGWMELGLPDEALVELAPLPWRVQVRRPILELRLAAEMQHHSWNAASETAQLLCLKEPGEPQFFLHAAYCLHETGDTLAACHCLLRGPKALVGDATFHYNLACYLNVLGQSTRARAHLETAFRLDRTLRKNADQDEDLVGIRE